MANFTTEEIEQFLQEFFNVVGTRQYIGARYIPIFGRRGEQSIEWNNSAPYEPLTVVTYQGNSYTSRTYVPTGVPITDTSYWASTGNYNSQVEAYRQEVLEYEQEVRTFDGRITANATAIANEVTARESAVGNEKASRESADNSLSERITANTHQISLNAQAISAERTARTNEIANEVTQRNAAIDQLGDDVADAYVPFPTSPESKYGNANQILSTLANGKTRWVSQYEPTDEQASAAITAWLNAHPEATTTVQDGSITKPKLADSLNQTLFELVSTSVNYNNYQTTLPTLAQAQLNSVYFITMSASAHQSDYPTDMPYNKTHILLTIGDQTAKQQWVINREFDMIYATRPFYSNQWWDWRYYDATQNMQFSKYAINTNNYQTLLPTLSASRNNSAMLITMSEAQHQTDYPTGFGYGTGILITVGMSYARTQYMLPQTFNGTYAMRRYYSNAWHEWSYKDASGNRQKITVGLSDANYTSLSEAIEYAYSATNCDVYVKAGSYDVIADYQSRYGAAYFSDESFSNEGMPLGHNCKYIFEAGAKVVCTLPANSSQRAQNLFSPFKSNDGDYEIYGLDVYSENCRYSVHDEMASTGDYTHKYENCKMHHNDTGAGYPQCIGGGLGKHGLIDIVNCVFESDTIGTNEGVVSWHNGSAANIQSKITIRDSYFVNGCVRFSWYGSSTLVSDMYISNCSFEHDAYVVRGETAEATTENVAVYAWNNETNRS